MGKAPQMQYGQQPTLYKSTPQKLFTSAAGYISPEQDKKNRELVEENEKFYEQCKKVAHATAEGEKATAYAELLKTQRGLLK
jgi:hypothetical protein